MKRRNAARWIHAGITRAERGARSLRAWREADAGPQRHTENSVMAPFRHLPLLIRCAVGTSTAHFVDNARRFSLFPEPRWIAGPLVVAGLWLLITSLAVLGWWVARRALFRPADLALRAYAPFSLLVLGHYWYPNPGPAPMPTSVHVGIALNAAGAVALLIAAPTFLGRIRAQPSLRTPPDER